MTSNTQPLCLNCGRPIKDSDTCECGYPFEDIVCPKCGKDNAYTNRFCISCGLKLWRWDVNDFRYKKDLFENHTFRKPFPENLKHTSLYRRYEKGIRMDYLKNIDEMSMGELHGSDLKADESISEILSRWKIVSPHYCINCFNVIEADEYSCTRCGFGLDDLKRVDAIKNNYILPIFDRMDLKMTYKYGDRYISSLAPAIGESQLEYRERLKVEFEANILIQDKINNKVKIIKNQESPHYISNHSSSCTNSKSQVQGDWDALGITMDQWEDLMRQNLKNKKEIRCYKCLIKHVPNAIKSKAVSINTVKTADIRLKKI